MARPVIPPVRPLIDNAIDVLLVLAAVCTPTVPTARFGCHHPIVSAVALTL
jgi:hypothetical protein